MTLHLQNLDNPANAFKQTKHISLDIGDGFWFEEKGRMNYEIIFRKEKFPFHYHLANTKNTLKREKNVKHFSHN